MFIICLLFIQSTEFGFNFLSPEISKKWKLDAVVSTCYFQREFNDSISYHGQGSIDLRWKINSFIRVNAGGGLNYFSDSSINNYNLGLTMGGPGGAFCDLGLIYNYLSREQLLLFLCEFQKNDFSGLIFSPGYFWKEENNDWYLSSRFFLSSNLGKTFIELSKFYNSNTEFLSFDRMYIKFGTLIHLPLDIKAEIVNSVRLGVDTRYDSDDWNLSLSLIIPVLRDPSSVRGTGNISGRVLCYENSVVGADIFIYSNDTLHLTSDMNGVFTFYDIPSGFITMKVIHDEYQEKSFPVTVKKNETTEININLKLHQSSDEIEVSFFSIASGEGLSARPAGALEDTYSGNYNISLSPEDSILWEVPGFYPAKMFYDGSNYREVFFIPHNYQIEFDESDFNDSLLSSMGLLKILSISKSINFYPDLNFNVVGSLDRINIIANALELLSDDILSIITVESIESTKIFVENETE